MDDLISRQAAIDELDKGAWGVEWDKALAKAMIESLPSAQPSVSKTEIVGDVISRQAAIDALHMHLMYRMGTDSNKKRLDDWINSLPSAQPEQRWIPCSERLPEEEKKTYWVCTDGGYQHECRWTNGNPIWTHLTTDWHWNIFDIPQYSRVIAWMPLPEPYKEKAQ